MRQFKRTAISRAVAQAVMLGAGVVHAQTPPAPPPTEQLETVVISGQRKALQTAQEIKRDAEEIVDSVVAEEAGKLPDRSITEVLQRVVGVTVQRQRSIDNDANHFSEENSGIKVRGLSWGLSTLNGREIFSAGWPGRDLSWGAVPTELMAGVDVYKNPSAERVEGAISGVVDLRTALPFDYKGTKSYLSFGANYVEISKKASPAVSALHSTQWENEFGRWGVLVDVAVNNSTYESESVGLGAYYPRTDIVAGQTVWAPRGASWNNNVGSSDRSGFYGALQWRKNDMQSALTYFTSGSKERDTGSGVYTSMESAYKSVIDDPVVDDKGVVVAGRYRYPEGGLGANNFADGGIGMGTTRAYNEHDARTDELAWNFKWALNDRWSFQNDLQWVKSTFETTGREVQLGTFLPSMSIDTSGSGPAQLGFDQTTRDFLANPDNYYWNVIQPKQLKGEANLYAWKADAKLNLDDAVLRDLRFGFRTTYRNSVREQASFVGDTSSTGWQSIAEPWNVRQTSVPGQLPSTSDEPTWAGRGSFAYLNDPRYQLPTEVFSFTNFHADKTGKLPDVVFPTYDMIRDYPNTYDTLMGEVRYQQCLDGKRLDNKPESECVRENFNFDSTLKYGLNPNLISSNSERTHAVYGSLRFGFDDWKMPVDGNVGARVVYSNRVSHGHIVFNPSYGDTTPPHLPRFAPIDEPRNLSHSHVDVLPSLNLRMDIAKDLQGRIAMSRSVYRPAFNQLRESISLKQEYDRQNNQVTYSGENNGNVKLKPLTSDNFDISLEWYPRSGQSITAVAFHKDVKDIIYNSVYTRTYESLAGNPQIFSIQGPDNAATGKVSGIELAAGTYFDQLDFMKDALPGWAKGFGVSGNYTYIHSRQKLYRESATPYCPPANAIGNDALRLYGCDTNGLPFDDLPLVGMAKHAANLALRYDRGPLSARLAYNWNSRVLQNVGVFGANGSDGTSADPARAGALDTWWGLPKWQEAYGQWDAGFSYSFSDKLSMSFSVSNLNNVVVRETQQQTPGNMGTSWRIPGRSYYLSGRYEF